MSATTTVTCTVKAGGKAKVVATVREDGRTAKQEVDTYSTPKEITTATRVAIDKAYVTLGAMKFAGHSA